VDALGSAVLLPLLQHITPPPFQRRENRHIQRLEDVSGVFGQETESEEQKHWFAHYPVGTVQYSAGRVRYSTVW
jgi:hypothetical protein